MNGLPYFAFIDESGVLHHHISQRFWAVGLLLVQDTSRLSQELELVRGKAIVATKAKARGFEFKFNRITRKSRPHYENLIDTILAYPVKICVFVVDKADPKVDTAKYFGTIWDAYIGFSKTVIKNNLEDGKKCIVIADFQTKPRKHPNYFESELVSMPEVLNATMVESHASIFIQAIDVLTGCVVSHFRVKADPSSVRDKEKLAVCSHLAGKLGRTTLADDFTVEDTAYFSVWKFAPK